MAPALPIAENCYACPRSHAALTVAPDGTHMLGGAVPYAIEAGLPNFLAFPPAEDEATARQLRELNAHARGHDWLSALNAVYGEDSGMVRYVTDSSRLAFTELLPASATGGDVLEIGPGLGQFTSSLGRAARSIHALEVVAGQAEFAAQRCRQSGLDNAYFAIGGDDGRLPYAADSFDLVVLNLVFEWCAARCPAEPHAATQRRMLDEIFRVLRPGGALYLATKNRYSLHYLIGRNDEHCFNIRFGNALPRWLCRFVLRFHRHGRQPGMLYSHNALEKMLRESGFGDTQSFWAVPEMRYPTAFVPSNAASIRQARKDQRLIQGSIRSTRWLMPLVPARWVKHVTQGLAFVATKVR